MLDFDLGSSGTDTLADTGSATVSGTNTINITGLGSSLSTGHTYNLITAASGLTGTFDFKGGITSEILVVGGTSYLLTLTNSSTAETLTVSAATTIYWVGTTSGSWDTTTMNWSTTSGGTANTTYSDGDVVVFNNGVTGTNYNITVNAAVDPGSISFQNTSAHAFTVTDANSTDVISGSTSLTVSGGGTVTLSGQNTFSGNTTVSSGTLKAGAANSFGTNSDFSVTGTVDLGGYSQSIGSLAGSGTVTDSSASTSPMLTLGTDGASATFSGVIQNGSGTVSVTKSGSGTEAFTGTNTYTGGTTMSVGNQLGDGSTTNGVVAGNIADNGHLVFADPGNKLIPASSAAAAPSQTVPEH